MKRTCRTGGWLHAAGHIPHRIRRPCPRTHGITAFGGTDILIIVTIKGSFRAQKERRERLPMGLGSPPVRQTGPGRRARPQGFGDRLMSDADFGVVTIGAGGGACPAAYGPDRGSGVVATLPALLEPAIRIVASAGVTVVERAREECVPFACARASPRMRGSSWPSAAGPSYPKASLRWISPSISTACGPTRRCKPARRTYTPAATSMGGYRLSCGRARVE